MTETRVEYYNTRSKEAQKALRNAFKKKNKFNAAKASAKFRRGVERKQITFDSKAEREHAYWLESQKQAGKIKDWKSAKEMPAYKLMVCGALITSHKVDFTVWNNDGTIHVHEVKSSATDSDGWRIRRKLFKVLHPEIEYKTFWIGRFGQWNPGTGRMDIDYDR